MVSLRSRQENKPEQNPATLVWGEAFLLAPNLALSLLLSAQRHTTQGPAHPSPVLNENTKKDKEILQGRVL